MMQSRAEMMNKFPENMRLLPRCSRAAVGKGSIASGVDFATIGRSR